MWKKSIILVIIFVISSSVLGASLSFDIVFPMTWYEKSVNAMTFVINRLYEKPLDENFSQDDCDKILGKTIFAHFCLERMMANRRAIMPEDILYFIELLDVLENQLSVPSEYDDYNDYMLCLRSIMHEMKKKLQIPSNVNSE